MVVLALVHVAELIVNVLNISSVVLWWCHVKKRGSFQSGNHNNKLSANQKDLFNFWRRYVNAKS